MKKPCNILKNVDWLKAYVLTEDFMKVTVYRHEQYNKFLVTIENGFDVQEFTLYDMTISELAEFIKTITNDK